MEEIQKKLTEMLAWFHEFCKKNDLRYYAIGGTMLGAVRHQGFIPWDDDIDVGMPREDYNRLADILKNQNGKYELETPATEEASYYYPFSKLYDTTTTLIEKKKDILKRGVYIDIFPLDGIGDSLADAQKNYVTVKHKYQLLITRVTAEKKGRGFVKNTAVVLMRFLPSIILNPKKIMRDLENNCSERSFYRSKYVANLVGSGWEKELMPYDSFGCPTEYQFEGLHIFGVEKPDEYLTALYGNWRELPPVGKRESHHEYVLLDLNKSYKDV